MTISRLKRVSIRHVWKNEERDFTPWLAKNIDVLGETLGMSLSAIEKEASVGETYEADLLVEGEDGESIVIENQFGRSDHDHLGKLLTYLTNLDAKKAIWICENPQPEHIEAIDWLNKSTPANISFYMIKLEVYQIGDSPPAPHFSVESSPSEQLKEAGEIKEKIAERHQRRLDFWKKLLERSKNRTDLFGNVSPTKENWMNTGAGRTGLAYTYVILMDSARVELYIDTGDANRNKKIFDDLFKKKEEIEAEFGDSLDWQRLNDKRASRIEKIVENKGLMNEDDWASTQDKMINAMTRLEKAFGSHIRQLG
jgi:hypothetical protein